MHKLWEAVLLQAIQDKTPNYFTMDNEDFILVCDLAGANPAKVIEHAYRERVK
jgi:hypothetical protein